MSSEKRPFVPKTPMDFQKLKLDRLMANPDKPVIIPETTREKKGFTVPEFVRNVMGSSAGAGSGEFHVYRHLRRKEYTRQKMIEEKGEMEKLDEEYYQRIEENKRKLEEKTAKRRAKRLKRKERLKLKATKGAAKEDKSKSKTSSEEESSEDSDNKHSGSEKNQSISESCTHPNLDKAKEDKSKSKTSSEKESLEDLDNKHSDLEKNQSISESDLHPNSDKEET